MKMQKLLALLMALVLCVGMLTGCGAASKGEASAPMENGTAGGGYYDGATGSMDMEMEMDSSLTDSSVTTQGSLPENMKIITTIHMEAETEDLDPMLASINAKIAQLNGYMEAQEIYNGSAYASRRYRNAYLTIRIPADNLNQFTQQVAEEANIVSSNTTTENVTLSYVAIESRITALKTEEARLLELLAKAENMEDLLMIESRLTEVTYELEHVSSQLRVLDNKIDYSTVHLNLSEVKEYTEVVEPETFGERVISGFVDNVEAVWDGIVEFVIFLLTGLPYFVLIAAAVVVVIIVIKRIRRKKKAKKETPIKTDLNPEDPQ